MGNPDSRLAETLMRRVGEELGVLVEKLSTELGIQPKWIWAELASEATQRSRFPHEDETHAWKSPVLKEVTERAGIPIVDVKMSPAPPPAEFLGLPVKGKCPDCGGTGMGDYPFPCDTCGGSGK